MIVFDTETTGLLLPSHVPLNKQPKIIEFAAIKLDDDMNEIDELEFLVNPEESLDDDIIRITGLTDNDLIGEPTFPNFYETLVAFFLGESDLTAHNVTFDARMLSCELSRIDKRLKFPWPPNHICTVEASYGINNHRLKLMDLHEHLFGEPFKEAHRAMNDVRALVRCVKEMRVRGML